MRYFLSLVLMLVLTATASAQDFSKYSEEALREVVEEIASGEKKVLIPMRDGIGLSSDIYRPKDISGELPTILLRTPYNFNEPDSRRLLDIVDAVSRGYVFIVQNERGRYYSEGVFEILGHPRTDGYDTLSWIAEQPWSNGKVGTIGCSSSAEWQLALAAMDHPAHAAMIPMAAAAGIGRVGEFHEQGNWYRGGVPRSLFIPWIYEVDNPLRAQIPAGLDQETRAHIGDYNDLEVNKNEVDWNKQIRHLPFHEVLSDLGEPAATFEQFIQRKPDDPGWFEGGLYHDNEAWGVPALWFNSWYDISIGPNMALFNHARQAGTDEEASENQYVVVAPVPHCDFYELGPETTVGEREMGDTSFDVDKEVYAWFDRWLKNDKDAFSERTPRVRYFTMGTNEWQSASEWPPKNSKPVRFYIHSNGNANSLYGDGKLNQHKPTTQQPTDQFIYDPMNPVQTVGGGDCCNGGIIEAGAFDQRIIEARQDVLVYTSEPLEDALEVTGFIDAVLYVSSDAKDTDFAVKLVDVAPDGTAYIIDDSILRARYREGYDRTVMMEKGGVYKLDLTPMTSSIVFQTGHRIRIEVTSSNFPKFVRNLNTGGDNFNESEGVKARNVIHHSDEHASFIELPVVH
jgi:putative CocE/NonD family hydrolase